MENEWNTCLRNNHSRIDLIYRVVGHPRETGVVVDGRVVIDRFTVHVTHIAPLLHRLRHEHHRPTTKTVRPPPIEVHKVTALSIERLHICSLETPGRTETVSHVPTSTQLPAAVGPAAVEQYTLAHYIIYISFDHHS